MAVLSYRTALATALIEEMERDESVFLMGEDLSPGGGAFGVTLGFQDKFSPDRVLNTPISEEAMVGCAVGAALAGMRPIVELMHIDFALRAMNPIVNDAAKMRFFYGERGALPVTIRAPVVGEFGAGAEHSQAIYPMLQSVPGLTIVAASDSRNAKGLLKSSIRSNDPVLFVEHVRLFRTRGEVEDGELLIPLGESEIRRKGDDVTVVATLGMVSKAEKAAKTLESEGISTEVIDPRTIVPLDAEPIIESVKKTGRLMVVDEGHLRGGFQSEVAALFATTDALYNLDAPVVILGAKNIPIPVSKGLEVAHYPQEESIAAAVRKLLAM